MPDLEELTARFALMQPPAPPVPPMPPRVAQFEFDWGSAEGGEEGLYRYGKRALESKRWDKALKAFEKLEESKKGKTDAALYWKAYVLHKLGRKSDALAALAALSRGWAQSPWLNDARALEIEVKQSTGQPVSPEAEADEDLKLLALNGLMRTEPERALPALEKILTASSSPRLKERALFVAAHNSSPRTRELLLKYARGGANPDLQSRAVEYLGHQRTPEVQKVLGEIYAAARDETIKRAVLRAYRNARAADQLVALARAEKSAGLRSEAVRGLGALNADAELWDLYRAEADIAVKQDIVRSLSHRAESADRLIEAARVEKDPKMRTLFVEHLGRIRSPKALDALVAMYGAESDSGVRKRIIASVRRQGNAKALVDLARAEKDAGLRRTLIEELSEMKSKEATDYLLEVLNK
ncbi:MAG: HEAT repeat domain-containing protein [Bryobacteraceae bacterium]|nr:HEAT repeat domain-containing protein [Bryobacteraceae bacterium]